MEESEVDRGEAQTTGSEQERIRSPVGAAEPFDENETGERLCGAGSRSRAPLQGEMQCDTELKVISCPSCKTELYPREHNFCFKCGKKVAEILSGVSKEEGQHDASVTTLSDMSKTVPQSTKVFVVAGHVEPGKQGVGDGVVASGGTITESLQQLAPSQPLRSVFTKYEDTDLQMVNPEKRHVEKLGQSSPTDVSEVAQATLRSKRLGNGRPNEYGMNENAKKTKLMDRLDSPDDNESVLQTEEFRALERSETLLDVDETEESGSSYLERTGHSAKGGENRTDSNKGVKRSHDAPDCVVAANCKRKIEIDADRNTTDETVQRCNEDKTEVKQEQRNDRPNRQVESKVETLQNTTELERGDKNKINSNEVPEKSEQVAEEEHGTIKQCVDETGEKKKPDINRASKRAEKETQEVNGMNETLKSRGEGIFQGGTLLSSGKITHGGEGDGTDPSKHRGKETDGDLTDRCEGKTTPCRERNSVTDDSVECAARDYSTNAIESEGNDACASKRNEKETKSLEQTQEVQGDTSDIAVQNLTKSPSETTQERTGDGGDAPKSFQKEEKKNSGDRNVEEKFSEENSHLEEGRTALTEENYLQNDDLNKNGSTKVLNSGIKDEINDDRESKKASEVRGRSNPEGGEPSGLGGGKASRSGADTGNKTEGKEAAKCFEQKQARTSTDAAKNGQTMRQNQAEVKSTAARADEKGLDGNSSNSVGAQSKTLLQLSVEGQGSDSDGSQIPNDLKEHVDDGNPSSSNAGNEAGNQTGFDDPLSNSSHGHESGEDEANGEPAGHFYQKPEYSEGSTSKYRTKGQRQTRSADVGTGRNTVEATMTVVFHAILSEKFQRKDDVKIYIRGEEPIFRGWKSNDVEMLPLKTLGNNDLLLRGETTLPIKIVYQKVPYKYVVVTSGEEFYEVLVEFKSRWGGVMNRCLVIPASFAKKDATWDKYDGFVYPSPGLIKGFFRNGIQADDRREFFREYFPMWKGFHVKTTDCDVDLITAFQKLDNLIEGVSHVWTSSNAPTRNPVPYDELKLSEAICNILTPKIQNNVAVMSSTTTNVQSVVDAVLSTVIIVDVFVRHHVSLSEELAKLIFQGMKLPPDKQICNAVMEEMDKCGNHALSAVVESVCKLFISTTMPKSLVHWLHALPLLHFLRRNSRPFVDLECVKSVKYDSWEWWGLKDISVRHFRRRIIESEAEEILPELSKLFHMDRLLPRSFMLLAPIEIYAGLFQTQHFSVLELCVTLRKMLPDKPSWSYTPEFINYLSDLFRDVTRKLASTSFETLTPNQLKENEVLIRTLVTLAKNVKQYLPLCHFGILCRITECLATLVQLQSNGIEYKSCAEGNDDEGKSKPHIPVTDILANLSSFLREAFVVVSEHFEKKRMPNLCSNEKYLHPELQAWSDLFSVDAPEFFHKIWHDAFKKKLEERVSKVNPLRAIEIFCQSEGLNCHAEVANCLGDAAFKAVDELVKPGQKDQEKAFNLIKENAEKCSKLLSRMLHKAWPLKDAARKDEEEDDVLLNHLLTWPTWPGFLQFFGNRSSDKITLTEEAQVMMTKAESRVEHLIRSVQTASVTVATMTTLEKHRSQFIRVSEVVQKIQPNSAKESSAGLSVQTWFARRLEELEKFRDERRKLTYFIGLCHSFEVDKNLCILRKQVDEDINQRPVKDLCARTAAGIVVSLFDLDPRMLDMISKVYDIQTSRIFNQLWNDCSGKLPSGVVAIEEIHKYVWLPLYEKLLSIKKEFLSGEILLEEVDTLLTLFKSNCYVELEKEFQLFLTNFREPNTRLDDQKRLLRDRIQQALDYKSLFLANQAACVVIQLKENMKLSGDFTEVEKVKKVIGGKFSSQPLKSVSPKLFQAGKLLKGITEERAKCLKTFTKCSGLVEWLKENIEDRQQLKVFVDLAMISAGESDVEIDRISAMHTSCLAFGSLIFGLKPETGFQELMQLCEPVWQAVDGNKTLPEKLERINPLLSVTIGYVGTS